MLPQEVVECGVKGSSLSTGKGGERVQDKLESRCVDSGEEGEGGRKSARSDALKNGLSPPEPAAHGNARIISDNSYYFFCLRGGVMGPPLLLVPP
jgi:hypothetical protein